MDFVRQFNTHRISIDVRYSTRQPWRCLVRLDWAERKSLGHRGKICANYHETEREKSLKMIGNNKVWLTLFLACCYLHIVSGKRKKNISDSFFGLCFCNRSFPHMQVWSATVTFAQQRPTTHAKQMDSVSLLPPWTGKRGPWSTPTGKHTLVLSFS